MAATQDTSQINVKGKSYDINKDFSWRELITVEELAGVPLAADGALDRFIVGAAFVFVVMKREDKTLEWDGFLDRPISEITGDVDEPAGKKPRPTKAAAGS
jgi:hypothetical protein